MPLPKDPKQAAKIAFQPRPTGRERLDPDKVILRTTEDKNKKRTSYLLIPEEITKRLGWTNATRINLQVGSGSNDDVWRLVPGSGGTLVRSAGTQIFVSSLIKHPVPGRHPLKFVVYEKAKTADFPNGALFVEIPAHFIAENKSHMRAVV